MSEQVKKPQNIYDNKNQSKKTFPKNWSFFMASIKLRP